MTILEKVMLPVVGFMLGGSAIMGPGDLVRTTYNVTMGGSQTFKREIIDYIGRDMGASGIYAGPEQVESALANELGVDLSDKVKIDPDEVSYTRLWDSVERGSGFWNSWVWTDLNHRFERKGDE